MLKYSVQWTLHFSHTHTPTCPGIQSEDTQGRSQPHSPGWARVPLSSFFPQILINLSYFSSNFTKFFLILAIRVGESPTQEGPGYATEDTIYTRVYSVFVQAFKARTNLCITHSKWGHFFTHLWTCLARTKRGLRPYPPTPILWKSEDSAHSHKARTEILTSLCQNVLTLNVKNWFWSSLWMPGRTPPPPHTHTHKIFFLVISLLYHLLTSVYYLISMYFQKFCLKLHCQLYPGMSFPKVTFSHFFPVV